MEMLTRCRDRVTEWSFDVESAWSRARAGLARRVAKSKRTEIALLQEDVRMMSKRLNVMEAEVAVEMAMRAIDDRKGPQSSV